MHWARKEDLPWPLIAREANTHAVTIGGLHIAENVFRPALRADFISHRIPLLPQMAGRKGAGSGFQRQKAPARGFR
jgi:hypothetical protein